MKEQKTLEKFDDGSMIQYMRVAMPMMSDRDNVMHVSTMDTDGGAFAVVQTVDHPSMPPNPKVVRMFYHAVLFLKQVGADVVMIDFEYVNLKGYLPASLLNMTIASECAKEFTNMVKCIYAN